MNELKDLIKREINSDVALHLYNILLDIWDNDNFIFSVLFDLKGDTNKQKMIEILKSGLIDTDEIKLTSMEFFENYVEEWLEKELTNEYSNKLNNKLREVWDYDTFVYDVLRFLDSDEKKQKMIDLIPKIDII